MMTFDKIPDFGDANAKISTNVDPVTGADLVDLTYSEEDKQGHMTLVKIGEDYRVTAWQKPGADAPEDLEEDNDLLERLQNDLKAREDVVKEAEALVKAEEGYTPEAFEEIKTKYDTLPRWDVPKTTYYDQYLQSLTSDNERAQDVYDKYKEAVDQKEELIHEASLLALSTDWKSTSAKMNELMTKWKAIGYSGKANNDSQWEQFHKYRQTFYERQRKHFDEMRAQRPENEERKKAIIEKTRELLANIKDYNHAANQMTRLFEEWKGVPSAGHETDEALWKEFNELRGQFYTARKAHTKKLREGYAQARDAKQALINEAKELLAQKDFSREATERMKELSKEWKTIGYAGRHDNDALWDAFKGTCDEFFDSKKNIMLSHREEWAQKKRDAIARRRDSIDKLEDNIKRNTERLFETFSMDKQEEIRGWIEKDKALIERKKADIAEMEEDLKSMKK